jgi:hypothetical protein
MGGEGAGEAHPIAEERLEQIFRRLVRVPSGWTDRGL